MSEYQNIVTRDDFASILKEKFLMTMRAGKFVKLKVHTMTYNYMKLPNIQLLNC